MSVKLFLSCVIGLAVASGVGATNPVVVIETSKGTIKVELDQEKAPLTVKNFLSYVDDKFYDGTIFHRVMGKENAGKDFMIQAGGIEAGSMNQKEAKSPIKNEASNGLQNKKYTIAMGQKQDDPDSGSSHFFINVADNAFLDKSANSEGYAVFGKVTVGTDVVDKIKAVPTANKRGFENVPTEDVIIKSITVEKK